LFCFDITIGQEIFDNFDFNFSLNFETGHEIGKYLVLNEVLFFEHQKDKANFFDTIDFDNSI
jgi:hypothetical protein